jgi:phosphoglycerate kinase
MRPVADRLAELTDADVTFAAAVVGDEVRAFSERLAPGEILTLENVRYEPGETRDDPKLSAALAELGEVYVNDAFGAAHRAHCSTEGVARLIPERAAGLLLEREVTVITGLLEDPARPLLAVLGGAKVSDKLGVIERLLQIADTILVGGAMCFPFLVAQGHPVGASLCSEEDVALASRLLGAVPEARAELRLPVDLVIADRFAGEAQTKTTGRADVPDGWMGLDIGPRTADGYAAVIAGAATVFWNGPMGAFELEPFSAGTRAIAQAVADADAVTVVGGGDSAAAMRRYGLSDRVSHLSTGGGASLELIEGRKLPGVEILR